MSVCVCVCLQAYHMSRVKNNMVCVCVCVHVCVCTQECERELEQEEEQEDEQEVQVAKVDPAHEKDWDYRLALRSDFAANLTTCTKVGVSTLLTLEALQALPSASPLATSLSAKHHTTYTCLAACQGVILACELLLVVCPE